MDVSKMPTLKTKRLTLREPTVDDWPKYAELMASDRSIYMGGPFSKNGAWGLFCSDIAQWSLMGHGALMIDDTKSGECLGQVGINHGPLFPEHELGWLIYPAAEGRGYAFEAAIALKQWAFRELKLKTLVSYIDPLNVRSCNLAERLGAELDPKAPRPDVTDLVYRHPIV